MRRSDGIRSQSDEAMPVLPYARTDIHAHMRWNACRALPMVLGGSLMGWIVAVNAFGLAYGSIAREETAAALFVGLVSSMLAYGTEIALLCTICGPRIEPRDRTSILMLGLISPAVWFLLARAQLQATGSEDALLLVLLGSVLAVPFLVVRPRL